MIYKNKKANAILNFIEEYGSANAEIIGNLFYSDCANPYYNASRRLKTLCKEGIIKKYRKDIVSCNIYYFHKPLSDHNLKILEVYSKLSTLGEVIKFEKEVNVECQDKVRRNDAIVLLKREDDEYEYNYLFIIEIDMTHDTTANKIRQVTESGYYQNKYGLEPTWIIVKISDWQKKWYYKSANIIYSDWKLTQVNNDIF